MSKTAFPGRFERLAPALAVTLVAASWIVPQATAQTASLSGRVSDPSGAVVPAVTVTITHSATAASRAAQTNEVGYYSAPLLPPGEYRVSVEQDGFKTVVRTGVILEVDERAEMNFTLEVGAVTEQIEVRADTALLNTVDASRGEVIENRRVVELPLNGRDYNQLALLSAGAVQPVGGRFGGFSIAGQRTTENNFLLDGVDNNGMDIAGAQRQSEMVKPSVDAIQEFKVQTNAYAAEFGRAMGGIVNVTTKSGTNQLHGTAFEFLRNEELDAKNFFDSADAEKPPFKRNQFGFSVGGPLYLGKNLDFRNKVFWFADYEGTRVRESSTTTSTIPTLEMRQGDFSQVFAARGLTVVDPSTGEAFADNRIPASRLDPLARSLIDLYPDPTRAGVASNFLFNSPVKSDLDRWDVRVDVNPGDRDTVFWRLSHSLLDNPAVLTLPPPAFGPGALDSVVEGYNTAAGWNHIFSPNLILSIRAGWNLGLFKRDNPAQASGALLNEQFGVQGGNNTIPGGFSAFNLTGYRGLGIGGFNPVDRDSQNRQISADLTWTAGRHTVKFGSNTIRTQNNIFNIRNEVGNFGFNSRFTGDGAADFLLGWASSFDFSTRVQADLRQWLHGFYAQDDWKITPRLTLNLGLRYEVLLPWQDKRDRFGLFDITTDPANPRLILAGTEGDGRVGRSLVRIDKNNFMPRLGLAYKLTERVVLRAGYGIFYGSTAPLGDSEFLIANPPFSFTVNLPSSPTTPAVLLQDGAPSDALRLESASSLVFSSSEREPSLASTQQWNFNAQWEFAPDWLWEVGYSGARGSHLAQRFDGNFSPPGPGNVNAKRPIQSAAVPGTDIVVSPLGNLFFHSYDGNSIYHALVTKVEKRFSSGFTLLGSYSFSKTIGDTCGASAAGNAAGCGFQDLRNRSIERGVDNQDVPHRFVTSALYELPFGRGRRFGSGWSKALDSVFGGWALGSIITVQSGLPFSPTIGGNPANTAGDATVNRPDLLGDPFDDIDRTVERDFNTAAFARQAPFQIGTAGRNILRGRRQFGWDFSAMKNFGITEALTLQFRFEAFQFTNTPRFNLPGNTFGTATFGEITGAQTPRNLQFGLKLIW